MTNVPTWISRMSAVALATASMSVFAQAPGAPDFIMHKGSVNLKISTQSIDGIDKDTVKTKDVINLLMGRAPGSKNEKDEKLGVVTSCAVNTEQVELVVYDKKTELQVSSGSIVVDIDDAVGEDDKNGDLKKVDLIGSVDADEGLLLLTGQAKYGKIGGGCAKDGDNKDYWNKDSVCAKNFKTKSVSGANFLGSEIVMSGKISAGSCQYAFDDPTPNPVLTISKTNDVDGELSMPTTGNATINYTIVVANTGNVDLTGVVVTDLTVDGDTVSCGDGGAFGGTLDTGTNVTCTATRTLTQAQFDAKCSDTGTGSVRNVATASSTQTGETIQASANLVDLNCTTDPTLGLAIFKASDKVGTAVSVDDVINYTVDVTNLSGGAITNVTVTDPKVTLDCTPASGSDLAIDGVMSCTGSYTVTTADVTVACGTDGDEVIRNIAVAASPDLNGIYLTDNLVEVNCLVVQ